MASRTVTCSQCGRAFQAAYVTRDTCGNRCRQRKFVANRARRDARDVAALASLLEGWQTSLEERGIGTANVAPELSMLIDTMTAEAERLLSKAGAR